MILKLLRSVIEFDQEISSENLVLNFQKLRKAVEADQLDWGRPEDDAIYRYCHGFFVEHFEMPSAQSVTDYFDGTNNDEVKERLKYVAAERPYARTNYTHLLNTIKEEQMSIKLRTVLKEAQEILGKGIKDEKTGEVVKGNEAAMFYVQRKAQQILSVDSNTQVFGDIRKESDVMVAEYDKVKNDPGSAYGVLCGINEIDNGCKGLKPGELWLHAAFPGELKCVSGDATVLDHATGRRRSIKELFDSGDIPTVTALELEGKTHRLIQAQSSRVVENGVRDVYLLTTSSGRSLPASANHKVFTPTGWRRLDELRVADWVAVPAVLRAAPPQRFSHSEVKFVGYLLGDGSLTAGNLTLTASNPVIREDFKNCLREMGLKEGPSSREWAHFVECFPTGRAPYIRVGRNPGAEAYRGPISPAFKLLEDLGAMGTGAYSKVIPDDFFGLPDEQVSLLLGALWATDGSCHSGEHERKDRSSLCRRHDISYASVSRELCGGIQSLLLRLGIQSNVSIVDTTYLGEPYKFYCVRVVTNPSKRRFVELVRVVGKEEQFSNLARKLPLDDNRPFPTVFISEGAKIRWTGTQGERWRYATNTKGRVSCHADTLALFASDPEVAKALSGDLAWEQVTSVGFRGREMTYDLSVPEHQSFVVNDIVTHNTMFASNWAYNAVTKYRTNVVFISLEMTRPAMRRNAYSLHSANAKFAERGYKPLDYRAIRDGQLTPEQEQYYREVVCPDFGSNPNYGTYELIIPDREWTMSDISMQLELLNREFEVGMVVIDYGLLVKPESKRKSDSYVQEMNAIVTGAKKMSLHFNKGAKLPVMMLLQINRNGKDEADKNDGVYNMSALTWVNAAEKDADVITTTYLNKELRQQRRTKISNLKNRDNPPFDPFEAYVEWEPRKIMSISQAQPEGFTVDDGAAFLNSLEMP